MKSSTGRWVSGENFFDRETDLKILKQLIQDRNHALLTGQNQYHAGTRPTVPG